jgi:hypothetical protein
MCHDADIISQITDRLDHLQMKIHLQWVKSHQDRQTSYHALDIAGRMNIDADSLAEHFWHQMANGIIPPLPQGLNNPLTAITLMIHGVCIPSHYSHRIRSTIQKAKHRQYLQDKHDWSDDVWTTVDFGALKSAFLTLDPIKRVSCSKRLHGWLNTGAQKKHISPTAVDAHLCPHCKIHFETQ